MDTELDALKTYLRVFAWVLLVTALLPFDFYGQNPVWPWRGILDGGWPDILAIALPFLGGGLFFALARSRLTKMTLSTIVLGSLALAWLVDAWSGLSVHPLGVYAHLTDGLPALFSRAFWLLILGIAVLAAGIRLGARGFLEPPEGRPRLADPWPLARTLVAAGVLLIVLFYFLPHRGGVPIFALVAGIAELSGQWDQPTVVALLAGQVLSLGPLLFALVAVTRLFKPAPDHGGVLFALVLAYLPLLSLLVGLRNLAVLAAYTLPHLRSAALMMTVTVGAALAFSTLVRGLWYEIPWTLGHLTSVDRILADALAQLDSDDALGRTLQRVNVLVRPFVRRRLLLWKSAAAGVPGAGDADLTRVMLFLERRWQEEQALGQKLRTRLPWWMPGHRITGLASGLVLITATLTFLAAHRQVVDTDWGLERDHAVLARIFTEELPAVVSEYSYRGGAIEELDSFATLLDSLAEAESLFPGLRQAVVRLLRLGSQGRDRLHSTWRARDRLNHLLHHHQAPYFVRSRVRSRRSVGGGDLFYILTYRVTSCRHYVERDTGRSYAVLHLVRADQLNVVEQYMGTTDDEETFVAVLPDRLAEFLERNLVPLLEGDDDLGEAARAGLVAAGWSLREIETLLGADDDAVAGDGRERLTGLLVEGLTRHELHHRWLGLDPDPPAALWGWMSGYSEDSVRGVAAELGAFLGELGTGPGYAKLRLALMVDALRNPGGHQGHHGHARVFLLGRLLGIQQEGPPRWQAYEIRLQAHRLAALEDAELVLSLEGLHREFFGAPLPVFEPVDKPRRSWDPVASEPERP